MKQTIVRLQTKLMREYYRDFSKYAKGKAPERKVAWVTAFTPVEILEALDIAYYYPESYAAVIAASEKEQEMLDRSGLMNLSGDCCSYSCCFNGCLDAEDGPATLLLDERLSRGIPEGTPLRIRTRRQFIADYEVLHEDG